MAQEELSFTYERINSLKPRPDGKRRFVYDKKNPGLRVQITKMNTITFQFYVWDRTRKKPATRTIGPFPTVSIDEARQKATEFRQAINSGRDIENEANQIRNEVTLNTLFDTWIEQFAKPSKKTWKEDISRYGLYIQKPFGKKKVSWFSPEKVRIWHTKLINKPKQRGQGNISKATANRAFALLSTIFNQMVPDKPNPCRSVRKFHENSRDRFLQPEELKQFFDALLSENTDEMFRDFVMMALYTGARRTNIMEMKWPDISFDRKVWNIPASSSKNKKPNPVPLIDPALKILERRKKATSSIFVFPGKGTTGHLVEPKRQWKALIERANIEDVHIHDLRRTLGSYQTMTGASTAVVGKTLGHKSPAATAVYARMNLDPVRASIEKAVEAMEVAASTHKKKVMPFK